MPSHALYELDYCLNWTGHLQIYRAVSLNVSVSISKRPANAPTLSSRKLAASAGLLGSVLSSQTKHFMRTR